MVTGGSKGIGLEVCRLFAQHGLIVVLTARNVEQGLNAVNNLKQQVFEDEANLYFHQLDITDSLSVSRFASWIESTFGGLDILVNVLPRSHLHMHMHMHVHGDNLSSPLVMSSFHFRYRNDDNAMISAFPSSSSCRCENNNHAC